MDESPNISEERRYEEEDKKMKNMIEEPLLYSATTSSNPKGGIRTIPFIIGTYVHDFRHFKFCTCVTLKMQQQHTYSSN